MITKVTEKEQQLANILRTTTEALQAVTAERDAQRKVLEQALEALTAITPMYAAWHVDFPEHIGDKEVHVLPLANATITAIQEQLK